MTRDVTPAGWPATGAVDEAFMEVQASFDRFCLAAGIEALGTDVTAACGPRRGRDAARQAHRWARQVRGVDGPDVTIPAGIREPRSL